jgi:hypothetical protein
LYRLPLFLIFPSYFQLSASKPTAFTVSSGTRAISERSWRWLVGRSSFEALLPSSFILTLRRASISALKFEPIYKKEKSKNGATDCRHN